MAICTRVIGTCVYTCITFVIYIFFLCKDIGFIEVLHLEVSHYCACTEHQKSIKLNKTPFH